MSSIDALLNKGFNLIKDSLITFCRDISADKNLDLMSLEEALVEFKPQWGRFMDRIEVATELMSHEHYLCWFQKTFRGMKHSASSEDYDSNGGSTNGKNSVSSHSASSISSDHAMPTHVTHFTSAQPI